MEHVEKDHRLAHWASRHFELSRGGSQDNIRPMEGLRGFAVFLVFLVHYVALVEPWVVPGSSTAQLGRALHTIGNSGVDLFFVLSGYLIYGSLMERQQAFGRFMKRRVERIYPAFLVVFFAYLVLSFVFPNESKLPATLWDSSVYVLQNLLLLPGIFPIEPIITVAWSLSYEMLYYLVIPALFMLLHLRQRSLRWRTVFFLACTAAITLYCALQGGPVRLIMFISGILLFDAMKRASLPTPSSAAALLALVAGLLALLLPIPGNAGAAMKILILFAAFFVLCLTCFREPTGWLGRAFTWTPLRWLGNMSYSYYLIHGLALKAGFLVLAFAWPASPTGPWLFWLLLPVAFVTTLLPSAALYLLVERPFSIGHPRQSPMARNIAPGPVTQTTAQQHDA